jgi:hypothetical protein
MAENRGYVCLADGFRTFNYDLFERHNHQFAQQNPGKSGKHVYPCPCCSKFLGDWAKLEAHMLMNHVVDRDNSLRCNDCDVQTLDDKGMVEHLILSGHYSCRIAFEPPPVVAPIAHLSLQE